MTVYTPFNYIFIILIYFTLYKISIITLCDLFHSNIPIIKIIIGIQK